MTAYVDGWWDSQTSLQPRALSMSGLMIQVVREICSNSVVRPRTTIGRERAAKIDQHQGAAQPYLEHLDAVSSDEQIVGTTEVASSAFDVGLAGFIAELRGRAGDKGAAVFCDRAS